MPRILLLIYKLHSFSNIIHVHLFWDLDFSGVIPRIVHDFESIKQLYIIKHKGQKISETFFLASMKLKKEQKLVIISALASKMGQMKKWGHFSISNSPLFEIFWPLRQLRRALWILTYTPNKKDKSTVCFPLSSLKGQPWPLTLDTVQR